VNAVSLERRGDAEETDNTVKRIGKALKNKFSMGNLKGKNKNGDKGTPPPVPGTGGSQSAAGRPKLQITTGGNTGNPQVIAAPRSANPFAASPNRQSVTPLSPQSQAVVNTGLTRFPISPNLRKNLDEPTKFSKLGPPTSS
jgi:hypothetical protein